MTQPPSRGGRFIRQKGPLLAQGCPQPAEDGQLPAQILLV